MPPRRSTMPAASGTTKVISGAMASQTRISPSANAARSSRPATTRATPDGESRPGRLPDDLARLAADSGEGRRRAGGRRLPGGRASTSGGAPSGDGSVTARGCNSSSTLRPRRRASSSAVGEQPLEPAEVQVVVVAQAPAGATQIEQLGRALALRLGVRLDEAPRALRRRRDARERGPTGRAGEPAGDAQHLLASALDAAPAPPDAPPATPPAPGALPPPTPPASPNSARYSSRTRSAAVSSAVAQTRGDALQGGVATQAEHGRGREQVGELVGVLGAQHVVVGAAEQPGAVGERDEVGDVDVDAAVVRGLALLQGRAQAGVVQALAAARPPGARPRPAESGCPRPRCAAAGACRLSKLRGEAQVGGAPVAGLAGQRGDRARLQREELVAPQGPLHVLRRLEVPLGAPRQAEHARHLVGGQRRRVATVAGQRHQPHAVRRRRHHLETLVRRGARAGRRRGGRASSGRARRRRRRGPGSGRARPPPGPAARPRGDS